MDDHSSCLVCLVRSFACAAESTGSTLTDTALDSACGKLNSVSAMPVYAPYAATISCAENPAAGSRRYTTAISKKPEIVITAAPKVTGIISCTSLEKSLDCSADAAAYESHRAAHAISDTIRRAIRRRSRRTRHLPLHRLYHSLRAADTLPQPNQRSACPLPLQPARQQSEPYCLYLDTSRAKQPLSSQETQPVQWSAGTARHRSVQRHGIQSARRRPMPETAMLTSRQTHFRHARQSPLPAAACRMPTLPIPDAPPAAGIPAAEMTNSREKNCIANANSPIPLSPMRLVRGILNSAPSIFTVTLETSSAAAPPT